MKETASQNLYILCIHLILFLGYSHRETFFSLSLWLFLYICITHITNKRTIKLNTFRN